MKVLVLTKRQYMGKDLLDDCFGRFWEVPLALARGGHEIRGIALSYRARPEGTVAPAENPGGMLWHSVNLFPVKLPSRHRYLVLTEEAIQKFQPDIIWSCSDAFHAILGARLAKKNGIKHVIDLYDNFESYGASKIPGVRPLFKRAVAGADGLSCVSSSLESYVRNRYRTPAPTLVLENAIRSDLFQRMERQACREHLGLPDHATIIGTAGALSPTRGIETLYRAFEILSRSNPTMHLALAGPRPRHSRIPRSDTVHDFGVLPIEQVPVLLNALDLGVVCNRDSPFGRYSFPQKAREMIACGTAMVGADVGGVRDILGDHPECLFTPDDPESLAAAIAGQLRAPTRICGRVPTWSDLAAILESFFTHVQQLPHEPRRA